MKAMFRAGLLFLLVSCATVPSTVPETVPGGASGSTPHASSSGVPTRKSDSKPRVVILYLSDLHGHLRTDAQSGGYARIASLIKNERQQAGDKTDVFVILGGDAAAKGSIPCQKSNEKGCFPLLKDLGIDLAALGNGELKRSASDLNDLVRMSGIHWISSNVKSSGQSWGDTFFMNGPRSGIRLGFSSWTIAPSPGEVETSKTRWQLQTQASSSDFARWAQSFKDVPVFWLNHLTPELEQPLLATYCAKPNQKLLAVLQGHNHVFSEDISHCVPVYEPGAFGKKILRLVVVPKDAGVAMESHEYIDIDDKMTEDPAVKTKVEALYRQYAPDADKIVAKVSHPFSEADFAKWVASSYKTVTHADVAIVNMGAIKSGVQPGDLSLEALNFVYPYQDELMGLDISTKALEAALCSASKRNRDSFLDNGSELVFAGGELKNAGTPQCSFEVTPKRGTVKIAIARYLVSRSDRWLGTNLQGKGFKYGIDTSRAFELSLKRTGGNL